jgi:hypothetical protein
MKPRIQSLMVSFGLLLAAYGFGMGVPHTEGGVGMASISGWIFYTILGMLVTAAGLWQPAGEESRSNLWISLSGVFAGLGLAIFIQPYGLTVGSILMLGLLLKNLPSSKARSAGRAVMTTATIGLIWIFAIVLWERIVPEVRFCGAIAPILARVFSLFGMSGVAHDQNVYIPLQDRTLIIATGLPDVFPLQAVLWASGLAVLCRYDRAVWKPLAVLCLVIFYLLCRLVWVSDLNDLNELSGFRFEEFWTFVTLTPIAIAVGLLLAISPMNAFPSAAGVTRKRLLLFVGTALLALGLMFVEPGFTKPGRVLVQEYNSVWEPSEFPVNTELYGVRTVYNYTNMTEDLARYYSVRKGHEALSDATLKDIDVLILKCPTSPYSPEELEAVDRFVQKGGGVWMIGDHTNVFGMNIFLNQFGRRVGIQFVGDAAVDPVYNRQLYGVNPWFGHPTLLGMKNPYLFYTSCSLRLDWNASSILTGNRLLIDNPDYSVNTFFGNFKPDPDEYIGPVHQAAVAEYGRGRVAAWSDSTVFSGFSVFMPGTSELAVRTVDWLNRRSTGFPFDKLFLCLGSLIVVFVLFEKLGLTESLLPAASGIVFAAALASVVTHWAYPPPTPHQNAFEVAFWNDHDSSSLPLVAPIEGLDPESYLTAFIAAQRVHARPHTVEDLSEAVKSPVIVSVGYTGHWTKENVEILKKYVESGGRLLLLDIGSSTDPRPLLPLGVTSSPRPLRNVYVSNKLGQRVSRDNCLALAPNGTTVLSAGGSPVAIEFRLGRGVIFASTTTTTFSDAFLGENSGIPNAAQHDLLQILYDLYTPPTSQIPNPSQK